MFTIKLFLLTGVVLAFACNSIGQLTTTQIFVVRHADRETFDDLNQLGSTRSSELKRTLLNAGIDSVFSTNFVRTKKTVTPLADAMRLPVLLYDSNPQLIKRILTNSAGKTLLVAGHSNTVPQLIKSCGCRPPFENIPDTQFDDLFLIIIEHTGTNGLTGNTCKLLQIKYGAITN